MSPKEIPEKPDPELSKEDLELSTAKFLKVTAAVADFY